MNYIFSDGKGSGRGTTACAYNIFTRVRRRAGTDPFLNLTRQKGWKKEEAMKAQNTIEKDITEPDLTDGTGMTTGLMEVNSVQKGTEVTK